MSSNFNGVRGQFVSPENDWQPDDFPAYASDVYLAEDGGERKWRDISLPFTISAAMAQRLAKIELERARRQMTVRLANTAMARTNLGLGTMATKSAADYDAAIAAKAALSGATFTGVVTAPNFVSSSDARLKSDVGTIVDALALVSALRGVRFTMDGSRQIGVIAQEVETVLPEVVRVGEAGQLSVAYGNITGLLIEAVKELAARVAALEEARP
jgi:hypothetical protein